MEPAVVTLNVGGVGFPTRRTTLEQSSSFFSGLVHAHPTCTEVFVDRDPTHFRHVLNWMRGVRHLPDDDVMLQELAWEADYYALDDLRDAITRVKARYHVPRILASLQANLRAPAPSHR